MRTLASYEVVTPTRVNEFGEVFPQSHHFSRKKRSSGALEPTPFRTHYRIRAYEQLFHLNLSANADFLAATYTEVHLGASAPGAQGSRETPTDLRHCFYRGQVNAQEENTAVFSLCGGLVSFLACLCSCDPVQGSGGAGIQKIRVAHQYSNASRTFLHRGEGFEGSACLYLLGKNQPLCVEIALKMSKAGPRNQSFY